MLTAISGWKGSDTMILLRWLLKVLREGPLLSEEQRRSGVPVANGAGDMVPCIAAMVDGCCSLLQYFTVLHKDKLWLERHRAQQAMQSLDLFVAAYCFLARACLLRGVPRFHMEPSLHMVKHMSVRLQQSLDMQAPRVLNPACWLCEASEDWVGRIARISRRVHARTVGKRTLQRYLIKMFLEFERVGM